MTRGSGQPVYGGVAIGKVFVLSRGAAKAEDAGRADPQRELGRLVKAREQARAELQALYDKALRELGEEQAGIIDVQALLLDDIDLMEAIEEKIRAGGSAAFAAREAGEEQAAIFEALDDDYMRARAADIRDVARRLVRALEGEPCALSLDEPRIVVAEDLTPSETVSLDKGKILAFVTRQGSAQSHTAILARMMNIPSLVMADIEVSPGLAGHLMAVDGIEGSWYLDPDEATLAAMQKKAKSAREGRAALEAFRGRESVTKKGKKINLFANIGGPDDVKAALEGDAEGIGLLRSEFLYLGRDAFPTEDELFEAYKQIVEAMGGKKVIIRTLDIGADKQAAYFNLPKEENPALGLRGIRVCLARPDIFRAQLRAIYRASAFGTVSIMFPMIISVEEVRRIKEACASVRNELAAEGAAMGPVELGIMIETPAAAVISDLLAKEVDFFSVGTNDLTQYTLAVDRQNAGLGEFYNARHEALMRLLAFVAKSAREAGIWAGICGELAADLSLTDEFIRMGFDELSVAPSGILALRKQIIESEEPA